MACRRRLVRPDHRIFSSFEFHPDPESPAVRDSGQRSGSACSSRMGHGCERWDEMQVGPSQEWKHGRPFEIPAASAIYAVSGILTLCVLPILFLLPFNTNPTYPAFVAGVAFLVIISGVGQLVIARGIYIGRRWGWLIAFVGSLADLTLNAWVLTAFALYQVKWDLLALAEATSASVSLLLSLVMIGLLLTLNSRLYCRMVDIRGRS